MASRQAAAERPLAAWPFWMARYVGTNSPAAFQDLVVSVGGSPPYGNVPWDEAKAAYGLIEEYLGRGVASERAYAAVEVFAARRPDALATIEVFRLHDKIASDPESLSETDVERGQALAAEFRHTGAAAYFDLLAAQLAYGNGRLADAADLTRRALEALRRLAVRDEAYAEPLAKAAVNGTVFLATTGDFAAARQAATIARDLVGTAALKSFASVLEPPPEGPDHTAIGERGSDFLEHGDPVRALEWLIAAERRARAAGAEAQLCGLLGDMAVAYNRLGNRAAAIETYHRAIELSRREHDDLNLSRWSSNLAGLPLQGGDPDTAEPHLREATSAAARTGRADQVAVAAGNLATFLMQRQRFAEALAALGAAETASPGHALLTGVWRTNRLAILLGWGEQLRKEKQVDAAIQRFETALTLADTNSAEGKRIAAQILTGLGDLYRRLNDLDRASELLDRAIRLYRELGETRAAASLQAMRNMLEA